MNEQMEWDERKIGTHWMETGKY